MAKKKFEGLTEEEIEKALLENIDDKLEKEPKKKKKGKKKTPKVETVEKIIVVKEIGTKEKKPTVDPKKTEVRRPNVFLVKFKTYLIILLFLLIAVLIGVFISMATGFKDFQDDKVFIMVAKDGNQGVAAVWYEIKELKYTAIDLSELAPVTDIENFHDYAKKHFDKPFDKVLVINADSISDIAIDDDFMYEKNVIGVNELEKYLKGKLNLPEKIEGPDPEWKAKSKLFGAFIKSHHEIFWISLDNRLPFIRNYKAGKINIYPLNGALYILRLLPMDKLITSL